MIKKISEDQFDEKKQYMFNMGIMNDGTHEDHAISWTYALDLTEEENENKEVISGYPYLFLYVLFTILIGLIITKKSLIKINKI